MRRVAEASEDLAGAAQTEDGRRRSGCDAALLRRIRARQPAASEDDILAAIRTDDVPRLSERRTAKSRRLLLAAAAAFVVVAGVGGLIGYTVARNLNSSILRPDATGSRVLNNRRQTVVAAAL